jgi:magnesium transporter
MINYYLKKQISGEIKKLKNYSQDCWVCVEDPSESELELLEDKFLLDEGLLLDSIDRDEMPRFEIEDGITYIYTRFAHKNADSKIITAPIMIAIGPKFLITVTTTPFNKLNAYIKSNPEITTTKRSELLLEVLELVVDSYSRQLNIINRQIRHARNSLNVNKISNKDFVSFVEIEDVLNEFLGDLVPANVVLMQLNGRKKNISFNEDDRDFLEDIQLSSNQLIDSIKASLKTIVNIRDAYTNIISNNLNRQIKILTTLTVVLTVPTIVGSFWGMNVAVPGQDNALAFLYIVVGASGFSALILFIFKKIGWL